MHKFLKRLLCILRGHDAVFLGEDASSFTYHQDKRMTVCCKKCGAEF